MRCLLVVIVVIVLIFVVFATNAEELPRRKFGEFCSPVQQCDGSYYCGDSMCLAKWDVPLFRSFSRKKIKSGKMYLRVSEDKVILDQVGDYFDYDALNKVLSNSESESSYVGIGHDYDLTLGDKHSSLFINQVEGRLCIKDELGNYLMRKTNSKLKFCVPNEGLCPFTFVLRD